jgi:V8-like Glu-specific endopeptidase
MKFLYLILSMIFWHYLIFAEARVLFNESIEKGIYGDDNRKLVSELNKKRNKVQIQQARSVLAQVQKWRITNEDSTTISIQTKSLSNGINFCSDEKFSDLPIVSNCTGFLVGSDLLLTAGHCVSNQSECKNNYWILDYEDASEFENSNETVVFKKEKIVSCEKILSWSLNSKLDYALIKLNRKIVDRTPLKIRRKGIVKTENPLLVIGHPLGLPKIMADKAIIRDNTLPYTFNTNADTFAGNSGSPVIDPSTQIVEGILLRGGEDFSMDFILGCNRSFHCLDNECKGETIQRSTVLPLKLIPKI